MIFEIVIVVVLFLFFLTPPLLLMVDYLFGGEDFQTSKEAIKKIGEIIESRNKQNLTLYDLGSSRGSFIFDISDICPNLKIVGIDNSTLRILPAKVRKFFRGGNSSVEFIKANIFDIDISSIDLVFVYLPRLLLPSLEAHLRWRLKPGSLVILYRVNFPNWQPIGIYQTDFLKGVSQNNIFVYQQEG